MHHDEPWAIDHQSGDAPPVAGSAHQTAQSLLAAHDELAAVRRERIAINGADMCLAYDERGAGPNKSQRRPTCVPAPRSRCPAADLTQLMKEDEQA